MVVIVLVAYLSVCFVFFKQKTAYEMRISDWSSDVCSSVLRPRPGKRGRGRDRTDAAAALRHRLFPLRQRARDPARPAAGGPGPRRSRSRLFLAGQVRPGRYRGPFHPLFPQPPPPPRKKAHPPAAPPLSLNEVHRRVSP